MKINRAELLLGLIISLGIGLRTVNLNGQPVSIYWDEAAMAYDAFSLTQTGQDMHGHSLWQAIFPSYGDYKLPLYIWLAAVMMKILGPTVTAFRLVSALSGSVLIGLSYLLAKEVFKSKAAGLASAVVIAFSPWAIHFSRVGFEANLAVTCLTGAVWLLFRARQKPAYLMGAAGLMGLSLYAYFSARFVGPLITLSFLLLYGRQLPRRFWSWLGAAGLVFFLIFWPIYRSEDGQVSQQFRLSTESLWNTNDHILDQNRYRELAGNHWLARLGFYRWWFLSRRLMVNLSAFFDWRYLFFTGDPNLRHGTGRVGLFLMPLIAFLGAGIIRGLKRHSRAVIFLLSWWLIAVIPAAIPLTVPHALRSLNALPAVAGLIGYGIASWLTSRRQIFRLIGIGLLVSSGLWFFYYWHEVPLIETG